MKTQATLALALGIGLGAGAGMTSYALHAAPTVPVFAVVEFDELTDPEAFDRDFIAKSTARVVEAQLQDGRYIVRSNAITALDGPAPKYLTIVQFQNAEKAKSYYDNMKAARLLASKSRAFIVQGLPSAP